MGQQRSQMLDLIGEWIGVMREGHAEIKMNEVEEYLDKTYFAWIGPIGDDTVFYHRQDFACRFINAQMQL